jgi:hypothetical protein
MVNLMNGRWFALTTLALLLLVSAAHVLAAAPPPSKGDAQAFARTTCSSAARVLIRSPAAPRAR